MITIKLVLSAITAASMIAAYIYGNLLENNDCIIFSNDLLFA